MLQHIRGAESKPYICSVSWQLQIAWCAILRRTAMKQSILHFGPYECMYVHGHMNVCTYNTCVAQEFNIPYQNTQNPNKIQRVQSNHCIDVLCKGSLILEGLTFYIYIYIYMST